MHHPMSFIVKGAELQNKFDELFAIQFYGHVHVADSSQAKTGGAVRVFSGAMQPPVGANEEEKKKYIPISPTEAYRKKYRKEPEDLQAISVLTTL